MIPAEQQRAILEHEEFVQKLIDGRRPKETRKHWYEHSGVWAVLTTLLGFVVASMNPFLVSRASRAQEDRKQRAELITRALEEVSLIRVASQNLVLLGKGVLDKVPTEEEAARKRANDAEEQWRREKESIGVWMQVSFEERQGVSENWERLASAASSFSACAEGYFAGADHAKTHPQGCTSEEKALAEASRGFSDAARLALAGG